ncbi:MAG: CBS domain-containing protein [Candidatus Jordarchaeaceae archaeon]
MISLRVKDVYSKEMHSLIVGKNTPVNDVIKNFAENPALRGIFVIDEKNQLMGVITRQDLLTWAKIMTGVPKAKNVDELFDIVRVTHSKTAEGMIRKETKNAAVKPNDDINTALDKMIRLELIDLPVVDEKGKVIGDLLLSKVLKTILEKGQGKMI